MKTTQNQLAKDLYFGTHRSQKEIADEVGITTKTLYLWIKKGAWDELRTASLAAPAIMVDNFCHMVVELQTEIGQRPPTNRFPTQQEIECLRKLVNCITKLKQYASTGMNMQVMADFVKYVGPDDEFKQKLQLYAEGYFKARKDTERYPNEFEYGYPAPMTNEEEIEAIKQELEERFGTHPPHDDTTGTTTPNFPPQPVIPTAPAAETYADTQLQPTNDTETKFPPQEKTGKNIVPSLAKEGWPQAGVVGLAPDIAQKQASPCHSGLDPESPEVNSDDHCSIPQPSHEETPLPLNHMSPPLS